MTTAQREQAVALFAAGYGRDAVATALGAKAHAVQALHNRWRLRGDAVVTPARTKRTYSFAVKHDVVQRHLAGETRIALAQEYALSSPQLVAAWVRRYRHDGEAGLQPRPTGRPRHDPSPLPALTQEAAELAQLRRENERLRAEIAYRDALGKVLAVLAREQL